MQTIERYVPVLVIILALFLLVQIVTGLKEYRYIGGSEIPSNVISVSGEGEVFAVADIATFTFGVEVTEKTVALAQEKATKTIDSALEKLEELGIEEKDIKTVNYSAYPRYEYQSSICTERSCPPSKQILVGYEVNQTIEVKVRKVEDAGTVLGALPEAGITNISGLSFTVDDETALQDEAREEAINDAKAKAEKLADQLGVNLVRIVSFSENGRGVPYPVAMKADTALGMGGAMESSAPPVPTGENRIVSNVSITYEIR